jgi:hypothetical protein
MAATDERNGLSAPELTEIKKHLIGIRADLRSLRADLARRHVPLGDLAAIHFASALSCAGNLATGEPLTREQIYDAAVELANGLVARLRAEED